MFAASVSWPLGLIYAQCYRYRYRDGDRDGESLRIWTKQNSTTRDCGGSVAYFNQDMTVGDNEEI